MEIFCHHIYEYKKGLRNLVLFSTSRENLDLFKYKLDIENIDHLIYPLGNNKLNIFFGDRECLNIIRKIGKKALTNYTAEEDFMLGIMLGYDIRKQCERFVKFKPKVKEFIA